MIECYYKDCPNHSSNHGADEPYCSLNECTASESDQIKFQIKRNAHLQEIKVLSNNKHEIL